MKYMPQAYMWMRSSTVHGEQCENGGAGSPYDANSGAAHHDMHDILRFTDVQVAPEWMAWRL